MEENAAPCRKCGYKPCYEWNPLWGMVVYCLSCGYNHGELNMDYFSEGFDTDREGDADYQDAVRSWNEKMIKL